MSQSYSIDRAMRHRVAKSNHSEEENYLIGFFGMEYVKYRDKTRVGIPFIQ